MGMFREPVNRGIDMRIFGTIINVYEDCPFQTLMDIYLVELGAGSALLETPTGKDHITPDNICHNGLLSSLGSTSMEMALKTLNHNSRPIEVTLQFLNTVRLGDTIKAEASVLEIKEGTAYTECLLTNQKDERVAIAKGAFELTGKYLPNI